ncbi:MAG: SDR family oxidoreductase [Euryarchaeota archaeon]|nr:SDR family oxidoreductase [Euryarchaeota archaeon]
MWNGTGKTALVTGATSGIGKAIATGLAESGASVTLLARNPQKAESTAKEIKAKFPKAHVEVLEADISSQASVKAAAQKFTAKHPKLDVLVHSAGVFLPKRSVTADGIETTFATNYLGTFQLTNLLLPSLKKAAPSRVVTVASRYGGAKIDFDDLMVEKRKFSYMKAVPASKLAQVLFTQELAERLEGTGVVANCLHPGLVANTQLLNETRGFFRWLTNRLGGSPEKGADTALWLALAPEAAAVNGKMFSRRKPLKTPGQGSDPAARKRLWAESEKLLGATPKKAAK